MDILNKQKELTQERHLDPLLVLVPSALFQGRSQSRWYNTYWRRL